MVNTPGTIDSDYRGEIQCVLINLGSETVRLSKGERIAQLVVVPVVQARIDVVDELDETERGEGGFGSTGSQ
jgi:dUTP pyrophosphatase